VLPLAQAAYVLTAPPRGLTNGATAFEVLADTEHPDYQAQLGKAGAKQQRMLESMLKQPDSPALTGSSAAQTAALSLRANPKANLHFGWVGMDGDTLVVAFPGTEFVHDWLDDFDFIPAPYGPIPGRGTVHQGFQLVYYSIRANLRNLVAQNASKCKRLVITGHSLGGALCALAAPDLLNDVAQNLSPSLYTWAEPRVGHHDFVSFFSTHVNICYRIVNVWDVVPHLPLVLAAYEHEGNGVTVESGFSLDMVRNHVLTSGYVHGMAEWNKSHPLQARRHFGNMAVSALIGQTA
jgi:Lipase (class 3)